MVTQTYESPLGRIVLCAEGSALISLQFDDVQTAVVRSESRDRASTAEAAVLNAAFVWLDRYFRGEDPGLAPPLQPAGSAFQRRVWALASTIPYGMTQSYGMLAKALQSSPRAVGTALRRNPILLMIPCHRVLGADGALTGFAAGIERKQALLVLEK